MRAKNVLVVCVTLALAGAGALALLGGATATAWHDYQGDIHPGHAYALQVPSGAEAFEIIYAGPEGGSAQLTVFDPAGERLAHYSLSPALPSARVVSPDAGRHILYVYEVNEGALSVRVSADQAPDLTLQKVKLLREDHTLETLDQPAALDKALTLKLKASPVFLTLLYEGSADNLDATIASAKGDVVTIAGESGVAFSPGVWSSLSGVRESHPENLDGTTYTVTAHAERFEGRLVLSAIALDLSTPEAPPVEEVDPAILPGNVFELPVGAPVGFTAAAGVLQLDALPDEEKRHWAASLSLYTPGDELLAHVTLDQDTPTATLELPEEGEYVAYLRAAEWTTVLATLETATPVRMLQTVHSSVVLDAWSEAELEMEQAPLDLFFQPQWSLEVDADYVLESPAGVAAEHWSFVNAPGIRSGYPVFYPENWVMGTYTLHANGLLPQGSVEIQILHYLRETVEEAPVHDHHEESEAGESEHEEPEHEHGPHANLGVLEEVLGRIGL